MSVLDDAMFVTGGDDDQADELGLIYIPTTFTVTNNTDLSRWATKEAGYDYTSVYIAAGTFSSSVEVDMTAAGTRVVQGADGSKLVFSSKYGLRQNTSFGGMDTWVKNVTIQMSSSANSEAFAFTGISNLVNCTATGTGIAGQRMNGFYLCTYLRDCTATVTGGANVELARGFYRCFDLRGCTATVTGGASSSAGGAAAYAILECYGPISNCVATAIGGQGATSGGEANGFRTCKGRLINNRCTVTGGKGGSGNGGAARGFYDCQGLKMNCVAAVTGGASTSAAGGSAFAFHSSGAPANHCQATTTGGGGATSGGESNGFYAYDTGGLSDCTAVAAGGRGSSAAGGAAYGFRSCNGLTRCTGIGIGGAGNSTGAGYAFISCKVMADNTASGYSTAGYQSCFLGYSGNGAAPSNTAGGGWNG